MQGEISAGGLILGGIIGQGGAPGNGISSVEKTGESGLTNTYTMTFTNGDTFEYDVKDGAKGDPGDKGDKGDTGAPGTTDYNELSNKPNLSVYSLIIETGNKIDLEMNNTTYTLQAKLYDKSNNLLSTSSAIDLPLESMIVSGTYDSDTKTLILTLDNGNTIEIPIGDLISGLQTEITANNKLNSDYVDDTGHTNKFVTAADKTNWNAKVGTTDYANGTTAGVFKTGNGTNVGSAGYITASEYSYADYQSKANNVFIGKGTLEAVITGKDLTTKAYVDGLVGDIETILEELDIGEGV